MSESFLIRRGGAWSTLVTAGSEDMVGAVVSVFTRLAGGDVGGDVMFSEAVVMF